MSTYIITNRQIITKNGRERINGNGNETALPSFRIATYDSAKNDYTLMPDLIEQGYDALSAGIAAAQLAGTARMFAELYQKMLNRKKSADVLFFIHGFNYDFDANLKHLRQLEDRLVKSGSPIEHIVYLSWPSRGGYAYHDDQQDAWQTGIVLARLFDKARRFFRDMFEQNRNELCRNRIHLAAHSMGNQVFANMVNNLTDPMLFPLFSEVVLLNSDVTWRVFEPGQPFSRLHHLCDRVHIYTHRSDDALKISRFTKNLERRLGSKGPIDIGRLPPESFVVDCSELKKTRQGSTKEKLIDHWGYLHRPAVSSDLIQVFKGIDEDNIPKRTRWDVAKNYFTLSD